MIYGAIDATVYCIFIVKLNGTLTTNLEGVVNCLASPEGYFICDQKVHAKTENLIF